MFCASFAFWVKMNVEETASKQDLDVEEKRYESNTYLDFDPDCVRDLLSLDSDENRYISQPWLDRSLFLVSGNSDLTFVVVLNFAHVFVILTSF